MRWKTSIWLVEARIEIDRGDSFLTTKRISPPSSRSSVLDSRLSGESFSRSSFSGRILNPGKSFRARSMLRSGKLPGFHKSSGMLSGPSSVG